MLKITSNGINEIEEYFRRAPEATSNAARMAINTITKGKGLTALKDAMLDDIAFPSGYLDAHDRLKVSKLARNDDLEAVITGRQRATSLARFASGSVSSKGEASAGVMVHVSRGRTQMLRKAWLVRLKAGASLDDDNFNVGLAVRLAPGEKINNKRTAHKSWLVKGQVALLYGPSVDQVFANVADDVMPDISNMVASEFYRQFARLSRGT